MKRFFKSEVGAAVIWVFCSVLMAAVISPWIYQAGKQLAAVVETRDLPSLLEWLGKACGRARFSRFFERSLLFSALVLMPLLWRRLRAVKSVAAGGSFNFGGRWSSGAAAMQIAMGCLIAGGLLWGLGATLEWVGAYVPKVHSPALGSLISKILVPAVAASLVEEWIFRGLLLGLWLRFCRPLAACIGTSVLFAFLHFLKPPDGMWIADPAQAMAGFELLGKILLHFTDPIFFVTDFATLVVVGLILAWARLRTGALWFSIGLHAGWILVFKGFNLFHQPVANHSLRPWGVGENLRSGMLPLLTLGVTAVICHVVWRQLEKPENQS